MKNASKILLGVLFLVLLSGCTQEEKTFYDNGQLKTLGFYDGKGRKDGKFKMYTQEGELLEDATYKKGNIVNGIKNVEFDKNQHKKVFFQTNETSAHNGSTHAVYSAVEDLPKYQSSFVYKNEKIISGYDIEVKTTNALVKNGATYSYENVAVLGKMSEIIDGKRFECQMHTCKTEVLQIVAVKLNPSVIEEISNPSEKVQLAVFEKNPNNIRYIKNPAESLQMTVVEKNPNSIQHINNPSENVQLLAVKTSGRTIRFINNPSENVQLAAVGKKGDSIYFINNPSENVQLAAVKEDGNAIQYINNPSENVQLAAVKKDASAIIHIKKPSEKVKLAARKK